jgi:hypothetical protein
MKKLYTNIDAAFWTLAVLVLGALSEHYWHWIPVH